ncbi:GtrA family protein [Nocardioides yefusunii]|uniref:GtrA family protein n=1 Tax=Nocardioides yefusunii TaxID=2500546 RepID=A0ABW1R1C7_9ACTN|nr:GtrA family protein [Nocardioides yefusunii]
MADLRRRLAGELSKFLTVGALATAVAFVIFNALVHGGPFFEAPLNGHPQLAYVLANTVGMVISFRGTRNWAFAERDVRHKDGGRTAFIVINFATMLIPMACLWISRGALGLDDAVSDNISANVIGLGIGTAARFALLRQYVFPREGLAVTTGSQPVVTLDGAVATGETDAESAPARRTA